MIIILLFFILAFLIGSLITSLFLNEVPVLVDVFVSFLIGLVVFCLSFFLLGWVVGLGVYQNALLLAFFTSITIIFRTVILRKIKRVLTASKCIFTASPGYLILLIVLVAGMFWFFSRAMFYDDQGYLVAGDRLVWTDWPVHTAIAANFAWGRNFPPQNPTFAGVPLVYPFVADFISGIFLSWGVAYPTSFTFSSFVLTVIFCLVFSLFIKKFLSTSLTAVKPIHIFITLTMCLFWGGIGWVYWLSDVFTSTGINTAALLFPPKEYSFWDKKNLWFFTFLYSEILPQRAFILGLIFFFTILLLLLWAFEKKNSKGFFVAGLLCGLMPFFHTHSFMSFIFLVFPLALVVFLVLIIKRRNDMKWFLSSCGLFIIPFLLTFLPQLNLFTLQSKGFPFVWGWMKGQEGFVWFWFKNTGLFIPLSIVGLLFGKVGDKMKLLGGMSFILFILPNLFQFAAWGYDNLKILTYWYLLSAPLVTAAFLLFVNKFKIVGKLIVSVLFLSLVFTGCLEFVRLAQTNKTKIGLWSYEEQSFSQEISSLIEPSEVVLTAPVHDHSISSLVGRKIVIGYPGNSWSWGLSGWDTREKDVRIMFTPTPQALALWKKYNIGYIMVGEREKWFEDSLSEAFIAEHASIIYEKEGKSLYKVKN